MHRQEAQSLALKGFSRQFTLSHWPRLLSYSRCFRPTITETDQSNLTSALGHPPPHWKTSSFTPPKYTQGWLLAEARKPVAGWVLR